jgi:glucose/arabinose dehydrogenase
MLVEGGIIGRSIMNLSRLLLTSLCVIGLAACVDNARANTPIAPEGLTLTPVVSGLEQPIFATQAPGDSERLFVLEQIGRIRVVQNGEILADPLLDLTELTRAGGERGLLGLAFHPDYQENGYFFVNYTDGNGDTQVVRYNASNNIADPNSAKAILSVKQPHSNHNGGMIAFGPDGYLYIGMGDGGDGGDPDNYGQNLNSLLGKILRLDINSDEPYVIPQDNPFVGQENVRPEIWSYGWRNPWRFSFDRDTGDLWAGDVGQNEIEEISFQAAGQAGGNYGWRLMEAGQCFNPRENCNDGSLVLPVLEYPHSQGASVTGGYRYRGSAIPELQGAYIYGDFTNGKIWLATEQNGSWTANEWQDTEANISSFGEDANGELFVVDYNGTIYRLAQE